MTKETMFKNYKKYAAHDAYIIGFIVNNLLYMTFVPKIMPRWVKLDYTSHSRGHVAKIKLYISANDRDRLIAKNSVCLGNAEELFASAMKRHPTCNKGNIFECIVDEYYNIPFRGCGEKIGFWHDGDITINGIKYQIKMNGAQIVVEKTLNFLKTYNRLGVTPPPTFNSGEVNRIEKLKAIKKNEK